MEEERRSRSRERDTSRRPETKKYAGPKKEKIVKRGEERRAVAAPLGTPTQRVLMSDLSFEELGVRLGDPLLLVPQEKPSLRTVGLAWYSESSLDHEVQIGKAMRESMEIPIGGLVNVFRLTNPQRETDEKSYAAWWPPSAAESVTITAADGMILPPKSSIREAANGLCLMKGSILYVRAFGRISRIKICSADIAPFPIAPSSSEDLIQVFLIGPSTQIDFASSSLSKSHEDQSPSSSQKDSQPSSSFSLSVGGLESEIQQLKELIDLSFKHFHLFQSFGLHKKKKKKTDHDPTGLSSPRGVLLYGPPGTGKTLLARTAAKYVQEEYSEGDGKKKLYTVNGPEIMGKFYGESEGKLRKIFRMAAASAPSVIFIDEIDAICSKREELESDAEKRVVATLLTLMDGIDSSSSDHSQNQRVFVIAATNRPNSLDPALRRPGRFDRELEIGVPTVTARKQIMEIYLGKMQHKMKEEDITEVASQTHGYVGADLAALCREAAVKAWDRFQRECDAREIDGIDLLSKHLEALQIQDSSSSGPSGFSHDDVSIGITLPDFQAAMVDVRPSAMRQIEVEVPKVRWDDIGGQQETKQKLIEAVEWPLKHPEAFSRMGIRPPRGVVLYGPPGCSKTMLAKALATESKLNFIAIKGPELLSKWVGESEKAVRQVFQKARQVAPSIVFFDEIDALAVQRGSDGEVGVMDRVLSQLLIEIDGIQPLNQVTVIAATNRPDLLDAALLRPGRMDRLVYVSPPDTEARSSILKMYMKKISHKVSDEELAVLVEKTSGFSGAEVTNCCREAALEAIEHDPNVLSLEFDHFVRAIAKTTPRITQETLDFYTSFQHKTKA